MSEANYDRKKILEQKVIFCTECDTELQNYCFFSTVEDIKAIKKNLAQCKKNGKFKGEFCSKLFIADEQNLENLLDNNS